MLKKTVFVLVVLVIGLLVLGNTVQTDACNGGKCEEPLPTKAKACDTPGKGPEHKCNQKEDTPVPPTVQPEPTKVKPTAVPPTTQPTNVPATKVPTIPPSPTPLQPPPSPTPTATRKVVPATACGDTEVCDPCGLLLEAIRQGSVVVITSPDRVTVFEDGSIVIDGDLLATGVLSETTND